ERLQSVLAELHAVLAPREAALATTVHLAVLHTLRSKHLAPSLRTASATTGATLATGTTTTAATRTAGTTAATTATVAAAAEATAVSAAVTPTTSATATAAVTGIAAAGSVDVGQVRSAVTLRHDLALV